MSERGGLRLGMFALAAAVSACASNEPRIVAVSERYEPALVERVSVIALADHSEAEGSGQLASDALETSLLASGYRLLRRRDAEKILSDRRLTASAAPDPARLQELGRMLGVDALVFGAVTDYTGTPDRTILVDLPLEHADPIFSRGDERPWSGGPIARPERATPSRVALALRLVDVETGETLWIVSSSADGPDLAAALDQAAANAMKELSGRLKQAL